MYPQPLIAVRDVEKSSRWYQELLGCRSGHGGAQYEQLFKDGRLLLQLHAWGDHDHPNLSDPDVATHGFGVLLWFETARFDELMERAWALGAYIVEEPHINERAQHREVWMRDLDGYMLVFASPHGDIGLNR